LACAGGPVESRAEIEVASHLRNLRLLFARAAKFAMALAVLCFYLRAEKSVGRMYTKSTW